jgi:hypothetical protein
MPRNTISPSNTNGQLQHFRVGSTGKYVAIKAKKHLPDYRRMERAILDLVLLWEDKPVTLPDPLQEEISQNTRSRKQ